MTASPDCDKNRSARDNQRDETNGPPTHHTALRPPLARCTPLTADAWSRQEVHRNITSVSDSLQNVPYERESNDLSKRANTRRLRYCAKVLSVGVVADTRTLDR